MSRFSAFLITMVIIGIGLGVPVSTIYFMVKYHFNEIIAGIICIAAIGAAFLISAVSIGEGLFESISDTSSRVDREKLNLMRAHQRAMLEEFDELIEILKEIKDLLKGVQEV